MSQKSKNYRGHIYVKKNLQRILNTPELLSISSATSVLFFPENVSLKQVKQSLKTIEVNLNDLIKKEKYDNEDR